MAQKLKLTICHLYPDLMDTYGDMGNIITIKKRCEWRGIDVKIISCSIGDILQANEVDIYIFGGGQDIAQSMVGKDLQLKKNKILSSIEKGAVLLSICGGYQLLQNYFETNNGEKITGIGLFDAHTEGSPKRMVQNLIIKLNDNLYDDISSYYKLPNSDRSYKLIGFENHSGKTYLENDTKPLGKVLIGAGNNGEDKTEGAIYKNAFGCYLHGSLLPKNPHFADYLISKALEKNNGKIILKSLNDDIEWKANKQAEKRIQIQK